MLKKILLVLALLLLAAGGVVFYLWNQATALPEWYEDPSSAPAGADQTWVLVPDAEGSGEQGPKTYEMRGFHKNIGGMAKARKAVKASRARRRGDQLEAGMVVDMGELDNAELSQSDNDFLTRARKAFPALSDRDVYIGVEDRPGKDGLSSAAKLRVGDLTYPLSDVATKLGLSEPELRRQLNRELAKMNANQPGS